MANDDLSNFSMIDLFRTEVGEQGKIITDGLLALEEDPSAADRLEALMRAAHSVKGAARLVGIDPVVKLAHVMEDAFVAAQNAEIVLTSDHVDILLSGNDLITSISELSEEEIKGWEDSHKKEMDDIVGAIGDIKPGTAISEKPSSRSSKKEEVAAETEAEQPADRTVDLANASMIDLFRTEVADQGKIITESLLALEEDPTAAKRLEALMRAAHSVKGAARLVGVDPVVQLAHIMEDVFVAAQNSDITLNADYVDVLLAGVDAITSIAKLSENEIANWGTKHGDSLGNLLKALGFIKSKDDASLKEIQDSILITETNTSPQIEQSSQTEAKPAKKSKGEAEKDRVLRVTAERWNYLMSLAGEVKVEAGWLHPYVSSLGRLKHEHTELVEVLDSLRDTLDDLHARETVSQQVHAAQAKAVKCRQILSEQISELDSYDQRITNLSERLHRETIVTRMRPFLDGVHGFQRMVRDIAKSLGKKIRLEINGLATQVDRDVLEKMEAPLNHLLRNAIDHGIESPEERLESEKPEQALIRLTATHSNGMLSIIIEDDGRGIDLDHLRKKVIEKGQVTPEMGANLSEEELLDFLFLPRFSTRDEVTDLSGRGVGLDVVLDTIQAMHGAIKTTTELGKGTCFHLQLPITLSVMSTLIVDIAGEPYAFPLARINHAVKIPSNHVEVLEDHQFISIDGQNIGIVGASLVFGFGSQLVEGEEMSVVIIGTHEKTYGVVVDRFIGQKELAVQTLDPLLGKIDDISATALLEDGSPVLIIDVDDLVYSVDSLVKKDRIGKVQRTLSEALEEERKHILVVDDSLTVREVERNLLEKAGYSVDIAVDGRDGWNAIRSYQNYDLIISDIDMPRMDGFELVRLIKSDRNFSSIPVIIVSYKERAEDRRRGLDAGADYYLTKGSFHDNTFLNAVTDLIGEGNL
ncbi:MAG: hybrid sensor histidine kinase/response regulator [Proteobacteria bacterium]|nr:hybrid sensor histidine kinase/response regulator [Pseudomonadota bacterium]